MSTYSSSARPRGGRQQQHGSRLGLLGVSFSASMGLCAACSTPPPDNTPGVRITSPVTNAHLPKGKAIDVSFVISGIDEGSEVDKDGKKPPFRLEVGQTRRPGYGRVVAYFDGTNFVSLASKETEPMLVPDPQYGSAAAIITPGQKVLSLFLQYNDGTPVEPQRPGEVTVIIDP